MAINRIEGKMTLRNAGLSEGYSEASVRNAAANDIGDEALMETYAEHVAEDEPRVDDALAARKTVRDVMDDVNSPPALKVAAAKTLAEMTGKQGDDGRTVHVVAGWRDSFRRSAKCIQIGIILGSRYGLEEGYARATRLTRLSMKMQYRTSIIADFHRWMDDVTIETWVGGIRRRFTERYLDRQITDAVVIENQEPEQEQPESGQESPESGDIQA